MAPNRLGPRPTCPNCRASIRYLEDPESGEVTRTNGAFDAGQADQFAFDDLDESDSESEGAGEGKKKSTDGCLCVCSTFFQGTHVFFHCFLAYSFETI